MSHQESTNNSASGEVENPSGIPMTPWYDPTQLLDTALQVMVSGLFTHHADRRAFYSEWDSQQISPLASPSAAPDSADTEAPADANQAFWFDFIADTGDGGNSTYTMARLLLTEKIQVDIDDRIPVNADLQSAINGLKQGDLLSLPRGEALILGGDLVYPTASELEYNKKLKNVFMAALPKTKQKDINSGKVTAKSTVVAFPQNHDWYDSLASFSQIFCGVEDKFLDMDCPQRQSYGAVKLPHDWWIFGLDFALSGDIDELQFEYFRKFIEGYTNNLGEEIPPKIQPGSKVILIYPEPVWTLAAMGNPQKRGTYRFEQLEIKIEQAIHGDVTLRLAGDQHYYRRYSSPDDQLHMVTCGSGGAFLHPTHGPDKLDHIVHHRRLNTLELPRRFRYQDDISDEQLPQAERVDFKTNDLQNFPDRETSFNLSKGNFMFFRNNKRFGIVTGASYFLIVWIVFTALHTNIKSAEIYSNFASGNKLIKDIDFGNLFQAFEAWSWAVFLSPGALILMAGILVGFSEFTRSFNGHAPKVGRVAGILHGVFHLTMVFVGYWLIMLLSKWVLGGADDPIQAEVKLFPFLMTGVFVFIFGYVFGSVIMGVYLYVSLNLHRWFKDFPFLHSNEAFSSLKTQDYKGFLRFRITPDKLEAFFIGVEKVPTEWAESDKNNMTLPTWVEAGPEQIKPILYDYWTVSRKS